VSARTAERNAFALALLDRVASMTAEERDPVRHEGETA
jgi:hypothetical protein